MRRQYHVVEPEEAWIEMRLVFDEGGMSVLWPLPNGYCRWSFELPDYHDADAEMIKDRLFTAGELLRQNQLTPDPAARIEDRQLELFDLAGQ